MCSFNIPFSGAADSLLQRARHEITRAGGSMNGDDLAGTFQAKTPIGSIQGNYLVQGQLMVMNITKKPFILSCKKIQRELEKLVPTSGI
jgi:hypothetical protein